jgi:hypothetical protein
VSVTSLWSTTTNSHPFEAQASCCPFPFLLGKDKCSSDDPTPSTATNMQKRALEEMRPQGTEDTSD